jgi:hypothetical protein
VDSENKFKDMYMPPVASQATHIVAVHDAKDRDPVITDVASLDENNRINLEVSRMSMLTRMFMADLNPTELGFLLNDTRVQFVECSGFVSISTSTPLDWAIGPNSNVPMKSPTGAPTKASTKGLKAAPTKAPTDRR